MMDGGKANRNGIHRLPASAEAPVIPTAGIESLPSNALMTRALDFWLLGGASLAAWAAIALLNAKQDLWSTTHHLRNIAILATSLSLFVNYPHFIASYRIAYTRGLSFLLRNWFQLLLVPPLLLFFSYAAFKSFREPSPLPPYLNLLNLRKGEGLVVLLISFMFLTVGWHYIKQTFGCMMAYGRFDRYPLTRGQRRTLLFLLYSLWGVSLIGSQTAGVTAGKFYGFPTVVLGISPLFLLAIDLLFWTLTCGFLLHVLFLNWKRDKKLPSLNFLVPLLALLVWWLPFFRWNEYFFLLVPFFHSLQYFPFVYRYERGKREKASGLMGRGTADGSGSGSTTGALYIVSMIAIGFFSFELIPDLAQGAAGDAELVKLGFFFAIFHVFINVHHYFIDNVIWRFQHPEVKEYLFGQALDFSGETRGPAR